MTSPSPPGCGPAYPCTREQASSEVRAPINPEPVPRAPDQLSDSTSHICMDLCECPHVAPAAHAPSRLSTRLVQPARCSPLLPGIGLVQPGVGDSCGRHGGSWGSGPTTNRPKEMSHGASHLLPYPPSSPGTDARPTTWCVYARMSTHVLSAHEHARHWGGGAGRAELRPHPCSPCRHGGFVVRCWQQLLRRHACGHAHLCSDGLEEAHRAAHRPATCPVAVHQPGGVHSTLVGPLLDH